MSVIDEIEHLGIAIPWALRSYMETAAIPAAVPSARLHARRMLKEWGLHGQADTAELVVSELVTNAIRASGGKAYRVPVVRLWLCSDHDRVLIQVWDGSERMPIMQDPAPDAESGRGTLLVDISSEEWGFYRPATLGGKVVWSLIGTQNGDQS